MIADGLDRMVLLLLVAGGAALFLGVVGIVSPTWAADHAAFLTLAGGAVPFLAVMVVYVHESMLDGAASREKTYADAELQRAKAEVARTPVLESGMTQKGTATPRDDETDFVVYAQRWRVMAHRFLTNADRYGFPIRIMVGQGVVTWDGWIAMTGVLCDAGVMVKSPRAGWASGWDYARWEAESRTLPLPCPMTDPPTVGISPTNNGNNAHNSAEVVVEGVTRTAD